MMKGALSILLIVCATSLSVAQPVQRVATALSKIKPPKTTFGVTKPRTPNYVMPSVSSKITHPSLKPSWHNYLANQVLSTAIKPAVFLEFKDTAPTNFQQQSHIYDRYSNTMEAFQKLKPQLAPLLYYQTLPAERHALSFAEKHQLLEQIIPVYTALRSLDIWIDDPATQRALTYMEATLQTLDPVLLHVLKDSTRPQYLPPQEVDIQTFCLYPDPKHPLIDPTKYLEGKHIAIINDDESILQTFESWYKFGILFPQATVSTHGGAEQFLLWAQSNPPDVIFTDIQLGDGTGYYVAYRLRSNGYRGGIIALTSYTEDQTTVQFLQAQGFDGLISLQSAGNVPLVERLTQAAQLYLQRKNQP